MFLPNATAYFEHEVEVEGGEDAFGDPISYTEWQVTLTDVPVRFKPAELTEQTDSGELTRRPATLAAPLSVDADPYSHAAGDRVTVTYRMKTRTYRMVEYGAHGLTPSQGHVSAQLADWGDT